MLKHSFFYLFARGVAGLSTFLGLAIYTRLLSPHQYGLYALALVALNLVDGLLFGWQRMVIARFIPGQEPKRAREIFSMIFSSWVALLLLISSLVLLVFYAVPDHLRGLSVAWLLALVTLSGFNLVMELHRAELQPVRYLLGVTARSVLSLLAGVAAVLLGLGASGPLWGIGAGTVLGALPGSYAFRPWVRVDIRFLRKKELVHALYYGIPLSIAAFGSMLLNFGDRYVVAYLLGPESVGLYTANFDLAFGFVSLPMQAVALATYPFLIRRLQEKGFPDRFMKDAYRSFTLVASVGSVGAVLIIAGASILSLFLGAAFRGPASLAILKLAAATSLINGVRVYHFDRAFHFAQKTFYLFFLAVLAALINILINVPFVSEMGVVGAARATFLVSFLLMIVSYQVSKRTYPLPFSAPIATAIGAIALVAFLWTLFQ